MFHRKRKPDKTFDPEKMRPVIRCSICNGEEVAGFKDLENGHFYDVMLIRNRADLDVFREDYGIVGEIEEIY